MAGGYKQQFTLKDIFNNKKLAGKIPLINYKERVGDDGKEHRTTKVKSVPYLIFDVAKSSARPFYKPLVPQKAGDSIVISGNLVGSLDEAFEAVYNGIFASKRMISYTANNADIIRSALKDGKDVKLWLRAGSMLEIEGMSEKQIFSLVNNVMENIFYNPAFEKTQNKYDLKNVPMKGAQTYEQRQANWQRRTGA